MRPMTARQEKFCLLIVQGETKPTAYEQAGYSVKSKTVAQVQASKLLRMPNIQNRIQGLQGQLQRRTLITLESLTDDLIEIRQAARAAGSFGPAVQATQTIAKLHGFMVDRAEVTVSHRPAPLPTKVLELSEDEWKAQFGVEGKHQVLKVVSKK